jgi:Fe-S cluster biogenesis protein NfuA
VNDKEVRARVAKIDTLLERVENIAEPASRDAALAAVQGLIDLYGEGLSRIVAHVTTTCDDAMSARVADALVDDELVSHLLLLHGLHPNDLHDRVEQALASVRPYLASHGGNVELAGIEDGVARVTLSGSCHGCAASELTLRAMVDDAVLAAAPELLRVENASPAEITHVHSEAGADAFVPLRRARHSTTPEAEGLALRYAQGRDDTSVVIAS